MARLTVTLDDAVHQALKEAAARQGRSISKLIEEGLMLRGVKPMSAARELVARARRQAAFSEHAAMELAVQETQAHRTGRRAAPRRKIG